MSGRQAECDHGRGRDCGCGDSGLPCQIEMSNPNIVEADMSDFVDMNTR